MSNITYNEHVGAHSQLTSIASLIERPDAVRPFCVPFSEEPNRVYFLVDSGEIDLDHETVELVVRPYGQNESRTIIVYLDMVVNRIVTNAEMKLRRELSKHKLEEAQMRTRLKLGAF